MSYVVWVLSGCGGNDQDSVWVDPFVAEAEAAVGRYSLTRWDEIACGAESGKSRLEASEASFIEVYSTVYLGQTLLRASACVDEAHCDQVVQKGLFADPFPEFTFWFTGGTLSEGLVGQYATVTTTYEGRCRGWVETDVLTMEGEAIGIVGELTAPVVFNPRAEDDFICTTDAVADAVEGAPCEIAAIVTGEPL